MRINIIWCNLIYKYIVYRIIQVNKIYKNIFHNEDRIDEIKLRNKINTREKESRLPPYVLYSRHVCNNLNSYFVSFLFIFLLQAELKEKHEYCKPGDEHPPPTYYHRDNLYCASAAKFTNLSLPFLTLIYFFVFRWYVVELR